MKKLLFLTLFIFSNLIPFRVFSAEESDPCMGEDAVSPVLINYYNEFKQSAKAVHDNKNHASHIENPAIKNSLVNYYTEFLK